MAAAPPKRVLIVDDHLGMAQTLAEGLAELGYDAMALDSSSHAAKLLATEPFDALITDLRMPEVDGLGLLAVSRRAAPDRPVIVMTAFAAVETAIEAIRQGAYHYLTKPFKLRELVVFLERALESASVRQEAKALKRALAERYSFGSIIGKSAPMRELFDVLERIKDAAAPVLLTGETGTGKSLVAHALHATSARASRPFVAINCASLPEALLESELFGHVKGAFTGAEHRAGLFVDSDGGTLLLDEIGEMTPALQAKLLHALERGSIRAVGATKERAIDARIIAATHRDLKELVRLGRFREDLYYRLDVIALEIPALRHRREDIPLLLAHLLAAAKARHASSPVERFSPEGLAMLYDHAWPGNVRELAHVVERVVLLGRSAEVGLADLPTSLRASPPTLPAIFDGNVMTAREVQRRYAAWALEQMGGHKTRAAERLGVDAKTLAKWLAEDDGKPPPPSALGQGEPPKS